MRLYRVFPWLPDAPAGGRGHPLHVPQPSGAGRADNPNDYRALYLSSAEAGGVAETFGTLSVWTPRMFGRPDLPGSRRALAAYELTDERAIFDLDDPDALKSLSLRPSQVVTRDREVTQRWALAIRANAMGRRALVVVLRPALVRLCDLEHLRSHRC